MKPINPRTKTALALALAGMLAIGPAMADDDKHGNNKDKHGYKHDNQKGQRDDHRGQRDDDDDDRRWSRTSDRDDDHRGDRDDDDDHDDDRRWSRTSDGRYHFEDRHRVIVHEYYVKRSCPPGLAKKYNYCVPPGHARNWQIGHPLPPNVIYYEVPQPLVYQFGPPPTGYRYVRVASDILLIAVGTGMIMDAIQDLGGG